MQHDARIRVSLAHLRALQGAARGLSFRPRQPSGSVLSGRRRSRLRGRGLDFEEMRDYLPGDDVRSIDWKATARTGSPHVRVFTEERDRPAIVVVDQRMSMYFGSVLNLKSVTAAEAGAIAAFGILRGGDRVGGVVFDDEGEVELAPRRSERTVSALLVAISRMNGALHAEKIVEPGAHRMNEVLRRVARRARHDHLVLVLSDFDGIDDRTHQRLKAIAAHNDLVLALVHDPVAERMPEGERAVIGDGLRQAQVDLSSAEIRAAVGGFARQRLARIRAWQREIALSVLPLSAGEETLPQVRRLLAQGAPRRRVR